jgi:hypothetical protein
MDCRECHNGEMEALAAYDDTRTVRAYNLYQCRYCGALCRHDVWKEAGQLWIKLDRSTDWHPKTE